MKLPNWWSEAPAWEQHEIRDHYVSETDSLKSDFLDTSVPFEDALNRRRQGEPLEYILGHCHIGEMTLKTDDRALVPRPETETLVRRLTDHLPEIPDGVVLDCGTGTGFMAGWASSHSERSVVASDTEPKALELASENIHHNDWSVELVKADRLRPFDNLAVVVANLPYVSRESDRLHENVQEYEPPSALFPGDSPLEFYREAITQMEHSLIGEGEVWLEFEPRTIGSLENWASDQSGWRSVSVINDETDRPRFLRLVRTA